MKKLFVFVSFFSFLISSAQIDFGVKTGLNYNSLDDLKIRGGIAGFNESITSEGQIGFHLGFTAQYNLTKIFVKGELLYVQNNSTYDDVFSPSTKLKLSTFELPLLIGFKVVGPLKLYLGPSFVYNIDSDFSDFFDLNFEKDLSLAYNLGTSVTINRFDIDLRYSSGFSENIASYSDGLVSDGLGYAINTRPSQFLLSLSYKIN